MSSFNLTVGIPAMALFGSFMVGAILPEPPPIEVHDLTYSGGVITQDRTISADGELFYADWAAEIVDAQTGVVVCRGSGHFPYPVGRKAAEMTVDVWTGDVGCLARLDASREYFPRAVWFWGDDQTSHTGENFTP